MKLLKCVPIAAIALLNILLSGCASTEKQSLYDEIGGHKTLNTIYGVAITRIYTDPVIGHYFKGVPKKHLRDQEKSFFTILNYFSILAMLYDHVLWTQNLQMRKSKILTKFKDF